MTMLNNARDIMTTSAAVFLSTLSLVAAASSSNIHYTSSNKYTTHAVEKQGSAATSRILYYESAKHNNINNDILRERYLQTIPTFSPTETPTTSVDVDTDEPSFSPTNPEQPAQVDEPCDGTINFIDLSAPNPPSGGDQELIVNYEIGSSCGYDVELFQVDCTTAIPTDDDVITPSDPVEVTDDSKTTITLQYSINKDEIESSPIWNTDTLQVELCIAFTIKNENDQPTSTEKRQIFIEWSEIGGSDGTAAPTPPPQLPTRPPIVQRPPINDECSASIDMESLPYTASGTTQASTADFTTDDDTNSLCGADVTANGVWYTYTPTKDEVITVNVNGGQVLRVYTGQSCDGLVCLSDTQDLDDIQELVVFQNVPYYFLVSKQSFSVGSAFTITASSYDVPTNDVCEDALDIDSTLPFEDDEGTTQGATPDFNDESQGVNADANGVWYVYTPTEDGVFTVSVDSNQIIRVYEGSGGSSSCAALEDVSSSGSSSQSFSGQAGSQYYMLISGEEFSAGGQEFTFTMRQDGGGDGGDDGGDDGDGGGDDDCQSIVDIAIDNPDFSTLVAAVTAAGLVDTLSDDGPFTVFAPTNDAFAALPEGTVDSLLLPENIDKLTEILTYHVIASEVASTDLVNGQEVETLNGESVTVNLDNGVKINDSNVITADIVACNGIIHVIDAVLIPPEDDEPAATEEPTGFPTVTPTEAAEITNEPTKKPVSEPTTREPSMDPTVTPTEEEPFVQCSVCVYGLTVDPSTPVGGGGKTCADLLVDAAAVAESSQECMAMMAAIPTCCPDVVTTAKPTLRPTTAYVPVTPSPVGYWGSVNTPRPTYGGEVWGSPSDVVWGSADAEWGSADGGSPTWNNYCASSKASKMFKWGWGSNRSDGNDEWGSSSKKPPAVWKSKSSKCHGKAAKAASSWTGKSAKSKEGKTQKWGNGSWNHYGNNAFASGLDRIQIDQSSTSVGVVGGSSKKTFIIVAVVGFCSWLGL